MKIDPKSIFQSITDGVKSEIKQSETNSIAKEVTKFAKDTFELPATVSSFYGDSQ